MLNGASVDSPQSGRMAPRSDTPLSNETGTYLGTGDLHENDDCRLQGSARRSVTTVHAFSLLATADPATQDSEGNTPLCLAAQDGNLAQAQQLIDKGANVHHINLDGDNALTLAATEGHLTFIEWLDSHCRQLVNHENYYAETALTLAARHGHQPLVQWLVSRGASLTHLNDNLKDALAEAVANGHLALAQWLSFQETDLKRVYPDGNNLFLHAVRAGHQSMAQWLEDSGVNSQQINEFDDSVITLAARHGHRRLLAWLLRKNAAGIHRICRNGDSPLLIAACHGHGETVKLLVQNGADTALVNYAGSNVLMLAATSSESLALWLCKAGINIHRIDFSGNNAFTLAAQSGFFQLMQTLEQLGINIHQVNQNNDNAFTLVAGQGSLRWCQWLAGKGSNIHQVNCQHHNAVTLAALAGSGPLLQWLCTEGADLQQIPNAAEYGGEHLVVTCQPYSFNAAILAASAGHFAEAQWLMQQGLSLHQRDYFGRNAVTQAVRQGQLDAVQWLIAQGIIPDHFPDGFSDYFKNYQDNAMSLAGRLGHLHIVQWLHQNGGSLDDWNDERILLIMAARRGDLPMTQWLCQQGADIGRLDNTEANTLSAAVSSGHLRLSQWLVGQGAEDIPDIDDNDALMLAAKGGHNAIFRWLIRSRRLDDRQANDLLLRALRSGHRSLAVWLCLKVCRSFCGVDNKDRNALMLAARHGFLWLTQWLSEHTPDINTVGHKGSALMLAAANGHLPVVQWLFLEKNADLYQKNWFNANALQLAVNNGQIETANWLVAQGMELSPIFFKSHAVRWINNRNNLELLQYVIRHQVPPKLLRLAMLDAAGRGDVPALACCLSAKVSLKPIDLYFNKSCFDTAAAGGSLAALEYLCDYSGGDYDVDRAKQSFLLTAAECGNLHIIQWFWARSGLSWDEKNCCLLAASGSDHFHIVKWLYSQGADIREKNDIGDSGLAIALRHGNLPMLEWFCRRGGDIHQVDVDGKGALSLAIDASEPLVAVWLFHRGYHLLNKDIDYTFSTNELLLHLILKNSSKMLLAMIFKMTSKIRRASLFHSSRLEQKFRLLRALELYGDDEHLSKEEVDARFARFNQYNDKTLEHKSLSAVANIIKQRYGTLKARLDAIDDLPVSSDCKANLRDLVSIDLEN